MIGVIFHIHQLFYASVFINLEVEMIGLAVQEDIVLIHIPLAQIALIITGCDPCCFTAPEGPDCVYVALFSQNQFLLAVSCHIQKGVFHGIPEVFIGHTAVACKVGLIIPNLADQIPVIVVELILLIEASAFSCLFGILCGVLHGLIPFLKLLLKLGHILHRLRLQGIIQSFRNQLHIPVGHHISRAVPIPAHIPDGNIDEGIFPVVQNIGVASLVACNENLRSIRQGVIPLLHRFSILDGDICAGKVIFIPIIIDEGEVKFLACLRVLEGCPIRSVKIAAFRNPGTAEFRF